MKFKKKVESGEFVPPEILKRLEERALKSPQERESLDRARKLERSKDKLRRVKLYIVFINLFILFLRFPSRLLLNLLIFIFLFLRWLKIEQRLLELDIAVKTSLNIKRPSPDRLIFLNQSGDLNHRLNFLKISRHLHQTG